MSLLEKLSMIKVYCKNVKKSICLYGSGRIDLFIVIALAVLIVTPLIFNSSFRINAEVKQVNLFLSPRFEELFGSEITETLLREFEERNPDIRVRTAAAPPDILIFDEGEFSAIAAAGALSKLDPYAGYEPEDKEEPFRPFADDQMAVPLVSFMDLLFYNIDILTAAGFDRPPKTRQEFLACAAAVSGENAGGETAGGENAGAALSLSQADRQALSRDIFSWIWAAGGDFLSLEDSSQRPSVNNRAIIADLNFLGALNGDKALAARAFETTGDQRLEEFADGKIAMMIASTSAIPFLREKMGDGAFGITTVPSSGGAGKYGICLSGIYAGLSANCEYPVEARSFLVFLAEKSPLFCAHLKAVPGMISDLIPGDYVKGDPFYSKAWDIFESSAIVKGFSGKPGAEEYEGAFLEELRAFFETGRTAQETTAAIQRRWDDINLRP